MQHLGWLVALVLSLVVGFSVGAAVGQSNERSTISNECRHAGAFAYKRTGFNCEVRRVDR